MEESAVRKKQQPVLCVIGETSESSGFVTIEVRGSVWLKEYARGVTDAVADLRSSGLVNRAIQKRITEHFTQTNGHFLFNVGAVVDQETLLSAGFRQNGGVVTKIDG